MLTHLPHCLLLAALSILISSRSVPLLTQPTVYLNCSGNDLVPLPHSRASTPFFKPQTLNNPAGWEEWLFIQHDRLPDGSELIYGYKWALGSPTSADLSHTTFILWACFLNGTLYREIVRGVFEYEEFQDGGFAFSIANNRLTWDPANGLWKTSVDVKGWIIELSTENVAPDIPFAPNYNSMPGMVSEDFFSRVDVSRGHSDGYMTFPWGLNITMKSVGSLKHTWSGRVISDVISAYVRGSTFLPAIPPLPAATVTWYQVWDSTGKEVDSVQYLIQSDDGAEEQVFRLQITDAPEIFSVVTTPKPASLPLSYAGTELTFPLCGPGASTKHGGMKMTWRANNVRTLFNFVDDARGSTLYQEVNITGVVWIYGASREVAGGIGIVEVYHRR